MKLRNIINEIVGVPEGIIETSTEIYNELLKELKQSIVLKNFDHYQFNRSKTRLFLDNVKIKMGSIVYNDLIKIDIDVREYHTEDLYRDGIGPRLLSASIRGSSKPNWEDFTLKKENRDIDLVLNFAVTKEKPFVDLIALVKSEKQELITTLVHELKHHYDDLVRKKPEKINSRILYGVYNLIVNRYSIRALNNFTYNLYYTSSIENLVRSSEVYSTMILNNVSKKDFKDFLTSTENYKTALELKNYTYENLKNAILKNMKGVDKFILDLVPQFEPLMSSLDDDFKLDVVLRTLFMVIKEEKSNYLEGYMKLAREQMDSKNMIKLLYHEKKFNNEISKFKDYDAFYKYEIKKFNIIGDKLIRKMAKVQSLLKEKDLSLNEIFQDIST